MNRKFILLLSLLIVAVGIVGILINTDNDNDKKNTQDSTELNREQDTNIALAISTHDIPSGTILTANDYAIKKLLVKESSELVKSNISSSADINRHLLKENVLAGSYLTKDMLATPDSDEFNHLVLKKGNVIYKFNLKNQDEYLLDSLNTGDRLSFQLITLETDKRKGMENGTTINKKGMNDRQRQNYSLNKLIQSMEIIRIKKYSKDELTEINGKNRKTEEMLIGYIDVIIDMQDLDLIYLAEASGEIILTPTIGGEDDKSKHLYDILPELRTIRELRG
ncbi:TPA: tight adherance operon protein [Yersinia enterocolitica]|uniref:tight adherance operon protein n=1 Tax=Yersinia enterocolitica TaxID=630 RepID=UPI001C8D1352|nr:tight adherance operon protein [Yersinia enterocolitica]EKN4056237.1 tight adherance operon protein [Yersinia enterocolitica]EKN5093370.1 tight adherance operon protein [Yersinia enterocolitica]MBX9486395.1 tight adherance operon protein [Yersinia enterocolitica]MBX9490290.1 tight adherance operon protein [Yersinia enterocolitica]HDL8055711.1 tight adherance operon protein [Yersinia enterocolitica]